MATCKRFAPPLVNGFTAEELTTIAHLIEMERIMHDHEAHRPYCDFLKRLGRKVGGMEDEAIKLTRDALREWRKSNAVHSGDDQRGGVRAANSADE